MAFDEQPRSRSPPNSPLPRDVFLAMNRFAFAEESITIPAKQTCSAEPSIERHFANHRSEHVTSESVATFAPIHYEPGYAYPLIIWLHSSAGNEGELRTIMPLLSVRNYVAVAPRAHAADHRRQGGYCWQQDEHCIEAAELHITECIDIAARRFHINSSRVFLAGCGSGGTMAMRVAWNQPQHFAGVISINGPVPCNMRPLSRVKDLRRLPCLLAVSQRSSNYSTEHVCRDLRLMHSAGCTVALRQYPGDHQLTDNMLSDVNRWIMEIVCNCSR